MTVLDLIASPRLKLIEDVFETTTIEGVFQIIQDVLKKNPTQFFINLKVNPEIQKLQKKLEDKHGFDISYSYSQTTICLRFRGYARWVYFRNGVPVYFTSSCSGILGKSPHETFGYKSEFSKLKFDDYKRLEFVNSENNNVREYGTRW